MTIPENSKQIQITLTNKTIRKLDLLRTTGKFHRTKSQQVTYYIEKDWDNRFHKYLRKKIDNLIH